MGFIQYKISITPSVGDIIILYYSLMLHLFLLVSIFIEYIRRNILRQIYYNYEKF